MSKRRMVEIDKDGAPQPELARYREAIPVDEDRENREITGADQGPVRVTRGEKKRRAEQLERLGESLVKLPPGKLVRVPMPDDLRAAVVEAQRIKAHGGYRRQIQFIGKIMRTVDARPIAAALEAQKGEDAPSALQFVQAERWRDRLIAEGDAALFELVQQHPHADRTLLRQLARRALEEQEARAHGKDVPRHASRGLFRTLRALFGGGVDTEPTDAEQPEVTAPGPTEPARSNRPASGLQAAPFSSAPMAPSRPAAIAPRALSSTTTAAAIPVAIKTRASNNTASRKTAAKKTAAKKTAAKRTAAKKSAAKKTAAKKSTAKKTVAKKTAAKRTASAKEASKRMGASRR